MPHTLRTAAREAAAHHAAHDCLDAQATMADATYDRGAYPKHTADAYELLVYECGFLPDVIVSDSAHGILSMVDRIRKLNPDLVWVPSAFHVVK